jgi:hypothetical protein
MSEPPPRERKRRTQPVKPPETDDDGDDDAAESSPAEAKGSKNGAGASEKDADASLGRALSGKGAWVWPLVAGLAIGYAVGREVHRFGADGTRASSSPDGSAAPIAPDLAAKKYAKQTDFPSAWLKDSDLGSSTSILAGLTDAQKVTVMQALNERNCECGCGMGSIAICLQKDPNCPRSPAMAKLAVDLVKQGKGAAEIEAAIDAKQKDSGDKKPAAAPPEPPKGPVKVELAAWNPRKGPKPAKVTVVEFSDFQ